MASRYSVPQSALLAELHPAIDGLDRGIAANLAAGVEQHGHQRLEELCGAGAIDQQSLGRAAYAGAAHLGIEHDRFGHAELGLAVDIDMADAFEVSEHRHARLGLHPADQILAAARHDHVDGAIEAGQHHADRFTIAGRDERDGRGGQPGFDQTFDQRGMDRAA